MQKHPNLILSSKAFLFFSLLLFSLLLLGITSPASAQQYGQAFCAREDVECVDPELGDYFYTFNVNNITERGITSTDEFVAYVITDLPTHICARSAEFIGSWTSYSETGRGQGNGSRWVFSLNWSEQLSKKLQVWDSRIRASDGACIRDSAPVFPNIGRYRHIRCPNGTFTRSSRDKSVVDVCYNNIVPECPQETIFDDNSGQCVSAPNKNTPCGVGNPCDPLTGFKYQPETDFVGQQPLKRYYHSGNLSNVGFGVGWRSAYHKRLHVGDDLIFVIEPSGQGETWRKQNGQWVGDADSDYLLRDYGSIRLVLKTGGFEHFSSSTGVMVYKADANQNYTYYKHYGSTLSKVTNEYGQSISFAYQGNNISRVTDSLGNEYHYAYDANDNLISVTYPDATPDDANDNPTRIYHYENTDYPNHLTGVTDENGDRYSRFAYDAAGKAILTEHAQTINAVPQERFQLNYLD